MWYCCDILRQRCATLSSHLPQDFLCMPWSLIFLPHLLVGGHPAVSLTRSPFVIKTLGQTAHLPSPVVEYVVRQYFSWSEHVVVLRHCKLDDASLHVKHVREKAAREAHSIHGSALGTFPGAQNWWCWPRLRVWQTQQTQTDQESIKIGQKCMKLPPRNSPGSKLL